MQVRTSLERIWKALVEMQVILVQKRQGNITHFRLKT